MPNTCWFFSLLSASFIEFAFFFSHFLMNTGFVSRETENTRSINHVVLYPSISKFQFEKCNEKENAFWKMIRDVMWCMVWCDENWVRSKNIQNIINLVVNVPNVLLFYSVAVYYIYFVTVSFSFLKINIDLICYKLSIICIIHFAKFQHYVKNQWWVRVSWCLEQTKTGSICCQSATIIISNSTIFHAFPWIMLPVYSCLAAPYHFLILRPKKKLAFGFRPHIFC